MELAERKELWNTTKSPTENIKIDSGTKPVHRHFQLVYVILIKALFVELSFYCNAMSFCDINPERKPF